MTSTKLAVAALLAALAAAPAAAADTWTGTANYGVESVGPFNTYDFSAGGVYLHQALSSTTAAGYYQSYVTQHLLDGLEVANPLLNSQYEITLVASFNTTLTSLGTYGQTFAVQTGSFSLWLDTTPDRSFATDSGFANGIKIMEGTVQGGAGSTVFVGPQQFGGGNLNLQVTGYDQSIFNPATIDGGEGIFSLRLGAAVDKTFLNTIGSVQGHIYNATAGDLKYAADGNLILTAVPEPGTAAMLLAGLGLIGAIGRRRSRR
jgi:hypothetical protein